MVTHMKVTLEISHFLMEQARATAQRERTALREIVERGLQRLFTEQAEATPQPFRLRKVSFGGRGLQPILREVSWETIRDLAYEGHGS